MKELAGRSLAIDAFNWIYQFLTTIRLADGSYLTDKEGNITTHLNGLFYRSLNLLSNNITPIFVFDGRAPKFKKATAMEREEAKMEAEKLAESAATREERLMYMRRTVRIDNYIVDSSKELLTAMGIPFFQAPAEGEAQAARINADGLVYGAASQDYDTLLFGAGRLIRNLNITNRKKVTGKGITTAVMPEIIESGDYVKTLGISREQLVVLSLLVGTDYNRGVNGIGPKKALSLVKKESTDKIMGSYDFGCDYSIREVYEYFLNPNVSEMHDEVRLKRLERENLIDFMCTKHGFDLQRISSAVDKIKKDEASLFDYGE